MLSIRSRLTAWNGGIIAVVLLVFASAGYELLEHASIEQVDQSLVQQMRGVLLAAGGTSGAPAETPSSIAALVSELDTRGFKAVLSRDSAYLTSHLFRGDRAELELMAAADGAPVTANSIAQKVMDAITARAALSKASDRRAAFTVPGPDGGLRVMLREVTFASMQLTIAATEPLDEVDELLSQARNSLLIAIPIVVAIGLLVGYLQARNALAPVSAMTIQAQQIGARNLHKRLPVTNPGDELGQLAATFNDALDRIDRAMNQQHQFTADASHELRTPIAIIRSEADVTLDAGDRTVSEYRETLEVIRDGSEHLSRIVNDLFLLARADAGETLPQRAAVYLDDLVNDCVRSMRSLALARDIEISVTVPDAAEFFADEKLLRRAFINLLDNAIKYSPAKSTVTVTLEQLANGCRILVSDTGPGIPESSRPLVFNRFYRVNLARSSDMSAHGSGAGLGLAIAREIVELHDGQLTLREPGHGGGATFEMWLPLA